MMLPNRPASLTYRGLFSLLLSYLLVLSLYAPLTLKSVAAVSAEKATKDSLSKKANTLPPVAAQTNERARRWRDGELLVRFRQNAVASDVEALLQANGARRATKLRGQSGIERLHLAANSDPPVVAASFRSSALVDLAEPNYLITADQAATNDPRYSEQWALKNTGQNNGYFGSDIGVEDAWGKTTGSQKTVIAVLDSGIDFKHPDLKSNEWDNNLERNNNRDDDENGFTDDLHGWDFVTDAAEIKDEQGHGTAVAGIIAAAGNNRTGITGVMWKASLMSLRVLDKTGTGDIAAAVEGIDYAVRNGAQVINCSWGTDDNSRALRDAINRASRKGALVITSAGNSSRDIETTPHYPASYDLDNLISVASTDNNDLLTLFSNWGAKHVAVAAPGKDILTTKMGGDYQAISGSSASAAFVTGLAGLVKSLRPWLSAGRTRQAILQGARAAASLSGKVAAKGPVNAAGALDALGTLRPNEGLESDNGNNGGEHLDSHGKGRGNQGGNQPGNGNSKGGSFSQSPPARVQGAPGSGLPNLDDLRRKQPTIPQTPTPVPSIKCSHLDPDCASDKRRSAIESPANQLALNQSSPSIDFFFGANSQQLSDSPFKFIPILKPLLAALQPQSTRSNVAAAASGGTVTAQNYTQDGVFPGNHYQPSYVIDGARYGHLTSSGADVDGFWRDEHGLASWIETDFNGLKVIDEVDVYTLADYPAFLSQNDPSATQTFTQYGVTAFTVQYWDGFAWATIPGGSVAGNNLVWKRLNFTAITTNRIRVIVNSTVDGVARIAEVEAWGTSAPSTNVALAANGASVTAQNYTTNLPGYHLQPSYAIDGQRYAHLTPDGSDADGFWRDEHGLASWLEISFNGTKTINEVDVFTFPDYPTYLAQADPSSTQTFSSFGVTAFTVQYWNGSAWVTAPGGNITGNNLVWKKMNFPAITTAKIKVVINSAVDGVARITEVEAWGTSASGSVSDPSGNNYSMARLDAKNRTGSGGVDLLSRNANWSLPILGLKGRAGLDLGLSLSYNSLVWTKDDASNSVKFDADQGTPGPGFRLGFPVIQPRYYNFQIGTNAYLLVTPAGGHTELRQVGTSNVYEAADSSYLQLIDNGGGSLTLRPTDGSQLSYVLYNGQYQCTQIKDRNGNFITINYYSDGRLNTVTDMLSRIITFNYDGFLNLQSITQLRGGVTHQWATFGWGAPLTVSTNFIGLTFTGPQNGTTIPVLRQVSFADGTHYNFDYNSYAQVTLVRHYAADNHQLSYTSYTLPASTNDCPRVTEAREWAENWNNNQEAVTAYSTATDYSSGQETMPDGTTYKELFATTSWQRGLTTGTEFWSGGVKKWTTTAYTQDDTNLAYQKNPRVIETNIYDVEGNRKRTTIDYGPGSGPGNGQYARWGLPYYVTEYAADGVTLVRRTFTDYNLDQAYLDRHIIGLVSAIHMSDGVTWQVKTGFEYDAGGDQLQATSVNATQHDASYDASFTRRGNLTLVSHYDVTDIVNESKKLITRMGYDTNGSLIFTRDPAGHQSSVTYADSFADNVNRNTFAYPTRTTPPLAAGENADSFSSTIQYAYDTGAITRTQTPAPAGQTQGAIQTFEYDAAGRTSRVNNVNNGAYRRWVYDPSGYVSIFDTIQSGSIEAYAVTVFDGAGRVRAAGGDNPNSAGGYRGQFTNYDIMGRMKNQTNPAEINSSWSPVGDDSGGWTLTWQDYDWKGRPAQTTNPDGTTKLITYGGCGCAGGEVVTVRDEVGRRQRATADALGRSYKTEVLNWDGSVYSTIVNTYNARDQITNVRHYQGAEASGVYQEGVTMYDGYGRLQSTKAPEQTSPTTYSYNTDGTANVLTDARGAMATFSYNNRHQVTGITYTAPARVMNAAAVSFQYDAAGNRTSMTDGLGSVSYNYDQLSRLLSETRNFTGVGSFTLSYAYNLAGELTSITDPWNAQVGYSYDKTGRLTDVTGSGYAGISSYASNLQYRAWGALKAMTDGSNHTASLTYNSRLQATHFEIPNIVSQNVDYDVDGRVHFVHNLLDSNFDRAYVYDHVGRLTEARSGGSARGDYGSTPYTEYFQYDAWGNTTYRQTFSWDEQEFSAWSSYVNNKETSWGYDADGRNTTIDSRSYSYDSAGRQIGMTGQQWWVYQYIPYSQSCQYDGDGEKARDSGTGMNSYTTYYLRSSALGGAVVAEVDASGQKTTGYVYAGSQLIAKQASGLVIWVHTTPANTGKYEIQSNNGIVNRVELDPVGADIGLTAPPVPDTNGGDGDIGSNHGGGGDLTSQYADMFNLDGGCMIDGMAATCSMAMGIVNAGAGVATDPYETPSVRWNPNLNGPDHGGFQYFHAFADGFIGYLGTGEMYRGDGVVSNPYTDRNRTLDHAEQTSQQTAGQRCDERLARIFGDENAVFATEHDPDTLRNGPGRNRLLDRTESPVKGHSHLYASTTGAGTSNSYAYTPKGFVREERSAYYAHADTSPELQNYHRFYYAPGSLKSYGYSDGLVISFIHTGPTDSAGKPFPVNKNVTNENGSIAVGIIGGYNNIVNGELLNTGGAGTGGGNVHTHMRFYQMTKSGRMGDAIDPRKVFCSDLGFR